MIDVLADDCDGSVANIVVEGLSVGVLIDTLDGVLMDAFDDALSDGDDMLGGGMIILVVEAMIVLEFAVSIPCSVDWSGKVMLSIVVRIETVVETLVEVIIICVLCVLSGTVVDMLTDVDANVLSVDITALFFFTASALLELENAAFSCWPMAVLGCDRALHALMPSYHV